MINLDRVEAQNFVIWENFDLDLTRTDNLTFIDGDNLDTPSLESNGSGKSLFIDMITFGLYGETIRGAKNNEIIGEFGKKTIVNLYFNDAGNKLKITRIIGGSGKKLLMSNNNKKDFPITQTYIDKWLMSWKVFRQTCLLGQDDVEKFMNLKDSKQKEVVTSAVGMDLFDDALQVAKDNFSDLEKEKIECQGKIKLSESQIENLEMSIKETKSQIKSAKQAIKQELNEIDEKIERLKNETSKINDVRDGIKKLSVKIERNKDVLSSFNNKVNRRTNIIKGKINSYIVEYNTANSTSALFMKHIDDLNKKIEDIKDNMLGNECPTCLSLVTGDRVDAIIKKISVDIESTQKEIEKQKIKINLMTNNEELLTNKLQSIKDDSFDFTNKAELIIDNLKNKLSELKVKERLLSKSVDEKNELIVKRRKINNRGTSDLDELLIKKEQNLKVTKSKLIESRSNRERISKEILAYKFWTHAFGPKGISAYVLGEILDDINSRVEEVMEHVVDGDISVEFVAGRKLKTKDEYVGEFDIIIRDNTKPKPVRFVLWSGGEKGRISFAIAMALTRLTANKLNLLLIDEAFDHGITSLGVERILDYIQSLKNKIVLISHKPETRKRFTSVVKAIKKNGVSTLFLPYGRT